MTSAARRCFLILVRFFVVVGVALTLSCALPACESQTAPRFPPSQEEQEDEPSDDDEDDG
jgi:hypothetical protein